MNWEYLAGFTDGDGCVTSEFSKGKYRYSRIRWAQKQSDGEVLFRIGAFLREQGLKVTIRNFSVARSGHKFPQMELGITNADDTRKALEAMLPFLIVKRKRAEEVLVVLQQTAAAKAMYGWKYRRHLAHR